MEYKGFEIASGARRSGKLGPWVATYAIYKQGAEVHSDRLDTRFDSFDAAVRAADVAARHWIDGDGAPFGS